MSKPVKVIHIITGLGVGGAEQMLKRLLLSDPEAKNTTRVISLSGIEKIGLELQSLGYQVDSFNFHSVSALPANFLALIQLLKKEQPSIVQTWMYHADFFGGLAARIAGCRNVIWGIRNTFVPINSKKTYWLMRLCAKLSYVIPKKIVCVAEASKNKHITYGYTGKKMQVIPNGFEFSCFDSQRVDNKKIKQELGLDDSDFIVGCVGRLHLDKGQDIFIKAAALLGPMPNKKIRFMLVGRGCDTANAELLSLIDSLGLSSAFILLGERDDIPECLAAMDVFCMPSRTEGFPNGLGEAMSMSLPCVATQVGDAAVLTADAALLVAPEDPAALAAGLKQMLQMLPEQRELLGQQAADRVRSQFSIDKARERFYALYREILELSY